MSGTIGASPNGGFPGNAGYAGPQGLFTGGASYNALDFMIRQIIAGKAHAQLVLVLACTAQGADVPAGFVNVQPMVNQIDGFGNQVNHGTIYHLPYFRLQAGANAVILDPQPGDIGIAVMCDRDISKVKATNAVAGPGSFRQHDWADGCYFGGFLGTVTPTQFVQFQASGITITSPTQVTINAPSVQVNP